MAKIRRVIDHCINNQIIYNNKTLIDFSSNDYLGLSQHSSTPLTPEIKTSQCASPMVSGYTSQHKELEQRFSEYVNHEAAIIVNSGYCANLAVISSLFNRHDTVLADKKVHASLIDGITLSRAKMLRFKHNNINHLQDRIRHSPNAKAIITESVFSMIGALSLYKQACAIAKRNNMLCIIDQAHSFGYHHLQSQPDITITPLGKALGGFGAIISGKKALLNVILQNARSIIYSTSLPAFQCRLNIEKLVMLQHETFRLEKLMGNINYFRSCCSDANINLNHNDVTPIFMVAFSSEQALFKCHNSLINNGIYCAAVTHPTVDKNTPSLRISLNTLHSHCDINKLCEGIRNYA